MFASAVTLALFLVVGRMLTNLFRGDFEKIMAALQGRSWASSLPSSPTAVIRFSQRYPAARPVRSRPEWRAAA